MYRLMPLLTIAIPSAALAQADTIEPEPEPLVFIPAVTEIEMGEVDVTAPTVGPGMGSSFERMPARFPPMIDLRVSFDQELQHSVSQIR